MAEASKTHNIPYTLSTLATDSLANIRQIAGDNAWFQLYTPQDPETRKDLLHRCEEAGYDTIMVTRSMYLTKHAVITISAMVDGT